MVTFPKNNRTGNDFYPTDPAWTRTILKREQLPGSIWEPAAGDGSICRVLDEFGYSYRASDIVTDDYLGEGVEGGVNFLTSRDRVDTIITNPPYKHLDEFIERSLGLARQKVLLLIGLPALASNRRRHDWIWRITPPNHIYVVNASMKVHGKASVFQHAWVVWDNLSMGQHVDTVFQWLLPDPDPARAMRSRRSQTH